MNGNTGPRRLCLKDLVDVIDKSYKGRDVRLPQADVWVSFLAAINRHVDFHYTDQDAKQALQLADTTRRQRKILDNAARILSDDLKRFKDYPGFYEHRLRWAEAISVLKSPRGATDCASLTVNQPSSPETGWKYTAKEVAFEFFGWAQKFELPIAFARTAPFHKALYAIMQTAYGADFTVTPTGFSKALREFFQNKLPSSE